jgi:hypothetical protein
MEKQKLPNATVVLILGIFSIITCWVYGGGLIFGIISLVLAKKDSAIYKTNPSIYDGYSNIKTGRILAIIGIILSIITIFAVGVVVYLGEEFMTNWVEEMQAAQGQ